jgi:putative two-component system response regulator
MLLTLPRNCPMYVPAVRPAPRASVQETRPLPLLIVDDDAAVLRSLSTLLTSIGYTVETAQSGHAALAMLERGKFGAMLCDVRMPQLSGLEVIPSARDIDPELAIIMVSAVNEAETATQALRAGAVDYVTKPIELDAMRESIERALSERAAARRRTQRALREAVASRTAALEREKAALKALTVSTAEALLKAMEARDPYLKGHSHRVSELAGEIATTLGLDAETVENVRLAGRLADIGKIGTRTDVLHKNGPLTPEEFDHVQDHVRMGLEILSPLSHLGVVLDFVRDHHEHYDGTGYPRALEGAAISLGGRILAGADAFVALTSRRPYREPMLDTDAIEHLRESAGSLLDWTVYAALRTVIADRLGIPLD